MTPQQTQIGWNFFFDPAVIVNHSIHAERLTPRWLRKRMFWQGVSEYVILDYYRRSGLETVDKMNLSLPLDRANWAFVNQDTTENLGPDMEKFLALGFVMAMSGIIPTN